MAVVSVAEGGEIGTRMPVNNQSPITRFSVIIPLYNKAKTIVRAIDSVLAQGEFVNELIVVDDGSTDDGAELAKAKVGPRVTVLKQDNAGVSAARNRGIVHSSGTHLCFLDADDYWEPGFLQEMTELLRMFPDAGLFTVGHRVHEAGDGLHLPRVTGLGDTERGLVPAYFKTMATSVGLLNSSSICVPREVIKRAGGFAEDVDFGEDLELWAKIAVAYPVAYSRRILAIWDRSAENRSISRVPEGDSGLVRWLKEQLAMTDSMPEVESGVLEHYLKVALERHAIQYLLAGARGACLDYVIANKKRLGLLPVTRLVVLTMLPTSWLNVIRLLKNRRN